jgi:hypothetical protein
MKSLFLSLVTVFAISGFAQEEGREKFLESERSKQKACADAIEQALSKATSVELFAIDYRFAESEEAAAKDPRPKFLDWRVAGQATLTDRTAILSLASALTAGIKDSEVGFVSGCFNPRHALRWKIDGKEITVIVCFQCRNGGVIGLEPMKGFLTTKSPEDTFDRVFSAAGLSKVK